MIKENENIEMENKKEKLNQQQLDQVSGGVKEIDRDEKVKLIKPLPWSPDEEPGNGGNL